MSLIKIDELKKKWDAIRSNQGYVQRMDPSHPLDFFIGIDENGYKEIVLITEFEPSRMKSSKSVLVEKGRRADGQWAIQIKLTDEDNEDVFARLCWDLVESSANCINKFQGVETVVARFIRWQKLLESGTDGMSTEIIKGLIGELKFAEEILLKKYSLDVIIDSWLGPDGSDRDFVFADTWAEVKAVATGKLTVGISSLNQLEVDDIGILAVAAIDITSSSDDNGFSFYSIIEHYRELLSNSPKSLFSFEGKLTNLGYFDRKEYYDLYFTFGGFRLFKVDNDFPRLTSKNVRNEIATAKYDLSLSSLRNWEIKEDQLWI